MLELQQSKQGIILPVRAQPNARCSEIKGIQQGALKVAVTTVPEKGKANKAIIQLLSKELGLKKSQIKLLSGQSSSDKKFLIMNLSQQEASTLIAAYLEKNT